MTDSPFQVERVDGGMRFTFDVAAATAERQRKTASFDIFQIACDESAAIGGDNTAPPPLAYFGAALAF